MKFPRNLRIFRGQLDASSFVGVRIQLPPAPELPGPTNATLKVALDRAGHLYFDNQLTPDEDLKQALLARKAEHLTLVVMADANVPWQTVVRVWNLARDAGVQDVQMATQPPVRARPPRLPP